MNNRRIRSQYLISTYHVKHYWPCHLDKTIEHLATIGGTGAAVLAAVAAAMTAAAVEAAVNVATASTVDTLR